ncbi:MAG: hypothetical protein VX265_03860 [Myxococcota bacterium]|nr:hypothetical protein [Myxococcota bacterium]
MFALLLAVGVAHAGWVATGTEQGCTFFKGNPEPSGALPVRVECDWDIDPAALTRVLGAPGTHHHVFASLHSAEILSSADGIERVCQVHRAVGASDREVVVEVRTASVPGGQRFSWNKATDQRGCKTDGVEPALSDGYWEVTARDGRTRLVYEVRYLAGGHVPAFLVRWFQGVGIRGVIDDLRVFMETAR